MWFGGQDMHPKLLERLVRYGNGFHPLGVPTNDDIARLSAGMLAVGRNINDLERIGGTRAQFPDDHSCADLGQAMASIPQQLEQGFTTFGLKPSQFIDDGASISQFCREVIQRAEAFA